MEKYNYFLFDWDGCLANTLDLWLDVYRQVFAEFKLFPEENDISRKVFGDWSGPLQVGLQKKDLEEFNKKLIKTNNLALEKITLNPNAITILEELKRHKKKITVMSTSARKNVDTGLRNTKLSGFFDAVVTSNDVSRQKPDPESAFLTIKLLQANLNEAVIIGDSHKDIEMAEFAKIDSVLYFPKRYKKFYDFENLKSFNPTYIINDFIELEKIIN